MHEGDPTGAVTGTTSAGDNSGIVPTGKNPAVHASTGLRKLVLLWAASAANGEAIEVVARATKTAECLHLKLVVGIGPAKCRRVDEARQGARAAPGAPDGVVSGQRLRLRK